MHRFPNINSHSELHLSFKKSQKPCAKLNLEIQIVLPHREPIAPAESHASLFNPVYSPAFSAKRGVRPPPDACAATSAASDSRPTPSKACTIDIDSCMLRSS